MPLPRLARPLMHSALSSAAGLVLLLSLATASAASAQSLAGDYLLQVDGHAILSLSLRQDETGRLTGTVAAAGKSLPLSGAVRGSGGVFVSSAPDGSRLYWEVASQGSGLAVVMAPTGLDGQPDASLAQRHLMVRGQPGRSGLGRGAQTWIARLSAAADSIVSWCSSPMYAESDLCVNAMQVLRKVAPALMVARFATSGQASSLLRVLAQGPGGMQGGIPGEMAPPMVATDDSFLSAIDPAPMVAETPLPDEFAEPPPPPPPLPQAAAPPPSAVPTLAQSLLSGAGGSARAPAPASSGLAGDWVLLHAGSELLRVRLAEAGGAVQGTLTLMGTPFPLSGSVNGGTVSFTTQSANGEVARWQGVAAGERLSLTLTTSSATERYELSRQGAGWSDDVPLARQWDDMLRGRVVAHMAGARDPATGAAAETLLHFCDDGVLRIAVAGTPGSSTPSWRVVANAEQAAVELTAPEGTIQVGLARGAGDGITFAGQPARVAGAAVCP